MTITLWASAQIDAALKLKNNTIAFFKDNKMIEYDISTNKLIKVSYLNKGALPGVKFGKIDAAVNYQNGKIYFFSGSEYVRFDLNLFKADEGYPKNTKQLWPGVTFDKIDATLGWPKVSFFFSGNQYIKFDNSKDVAFTNYPKKITPQTWTNVPFESFDATFSHNNKTYIFKNDAYIIYDEVNSGNTGKVLDLKNFPDLYNEIYPNNISNNKDNSQKQNIIYKDNAKLIAHFPMNNTTEDIVGFHTHLSMKNCTYQDGGIFTKGIYGTQETMNAIHAIEINDLDYQEFAISIDTKPTEYKEMNVFTLNRSNRLLGCYIDKDGFYSLLLNNGETRKTSDVKMQLNTWQNITISYNNKTKIAQLFIDKKLATSLNVPLDQKTIVSPYVGKDISTVNYSNGWAFTGVCKNLKVINGSFNPETFDNLKGEGYGSIANANHSDNQDEQGVIPNFVKGQPMKEINDVAYRDLAKKGVVFINFAQPTCDLSEYYIERIENINATLPEIPIYSFNLEKYPEIVKEYGLYGARFLAMIKNGKFVSHYEGFTGDNLMREWIIKEWNKDKGTHIPIDNYRSKPKNTQENNIDLNTVVNFKYTFDNSNIENFTVNPENAKIVGGVLETNGAYRTSISTGTKSISPIKNGNLSMYIEFMPLINQFNTVWMESSREMGIVIQKGKLVFTFNNGNYGYVAQEINIKPLEWCKLAFSYDHSTKVIQCIVNDQRIDDFKIDSKITTSLYSSSWGITNFGSGDVFSGYLDNIYIYGESLKENNLMSMYNRHNKGVTNITSILPSSIIANFEFDDKTNKINQKEEFNIISDVSFLTNGHLKISNAFKNSPVIETSDLLGLNPENTTIMMDFMTKEKSQKMTSNLFSIENTFNKNYATVSIKDGDIEVDLKYYVKNWEDKSLRLKTESLNLVDNKWYHLIISLDEKNKKVIVMIDGKEVLNKTYQTMLLPHQSTDKARVVFQKYAYAPTSFNGFIDNLIIKRSASNNSEMSDLFKNRKNPGEIGTVISPNPISFQEHTENLGVQLHEWGYSDYQSFDYNSFSKLSIINQPIDYHNFDQELLNACIFYQTNYQRKKHGRKAFEHIKALEKAATMHSKDMVDLNFFSHDNPYDNSKATPHKRIQYFGLNPIASSENIAMRYENQISYWYFAELIVQQWMDSPGHRQNILDERLNALGCGAVFSVSNDGTGSNFRATQKLAQK